MHGAPRFLALVAAAVLAATACERTPRDRAVPASRASAPGDAPTGATPVDVRIDAVLADPADVPDDRGEWIRLRNAGRAPVALRGWSIVSGGDAAHVIGRALALPAGATVVLSRAPTAGAAYAYGGGIALGNDGDWVVLRDPTGRTVDSLAWGRAPRGRPVLRRAGSSGTPAVPAAPAVPGRVGGPAPPGTAQAATGDRALVVRVLDVGQGDAVLVENGGSRILVDGGPDPEALGRHLDALGLDGDTIDAVVVTHPHLDHYNGLRELFRSRRRITVRYFIEARDPSPNRTMATLRDSVAARAARGQLVIRDADDPCGDGRATCPIRMRGGATLFVMRPYAGRSDSTPNNRSVPALLVGPDSASFSMWMAGDAEHDAIAWMQRAGYPMRARVMKANHHGSCNGITRAYLLAVRPEVVALSLEARNDFGFVHAQTLDLLAGAGVRWWRTDQNGTVTFTSPGTPGGGYAVRVERGAASARGPVDRASSQAACRGRPPR